MLDGGSEPSPWWPSGGEDWHLSLGQQNTIPQLLYLCIVVSSYTGLRKEIESNQDNVSEDHGGDGDDSDSANGKPH